MDYKVHKVVNSLPGTLEANSVYYVKMGSRVDHYVTNDVGVVVACPVREPIIQQFSGQFLLDPNEVNGWGNQGFVNNSNTQDLGDVGAANLSRLSGGFVFPYDVRLVKMEAWHSNSNASAQAWGWVVFKQLKTSNSNTVTTTYIADESFDRGDGYFGLRNYGNNQNQFSSLDFNDVIAAGEMLCLGVGAPTAVGTNYYVQVMGGYFQFERV